MPLSSIDQLGTRLEIPFPPQRIVSLVPSQTEYLFDLELNEEIVGVTRFCIHPEEKIKEKVKVGGTKKFNVERIKQLKPDLIIGNKEENYEAGIVELQKAFPVWMSDIFDLRGALSMMNEVARIVNREKEGIAIIEEIKRGFQQLTAATMPVRTCAYFIWRKPYMVAAEQTFIQDMLTSLGMKNVFEGLSRYPEIDPGILSDLKPDFIFLSTEPYSFSSERIEEFKEFCPSAKVMLVDGEMFSWYGSRLRKVPDYFEILRHELTFS